ncbi:MAG: flagellar hook-associated protein FlgK [Methylococcales bacterium]|jgi:flagellar hook-associated protein 1|nr:flagellar hook-associated protein FlgK [Methylococcales bacterium]MBT7409725.1 flagellar hook-associated protein FlgK [Methylococcales bacterium]
MAGISAPSLSGLLAAQRALATTSHNIANVNTEGYSRQEVSYTARIGVATGSGAQGNGVDVASVERKFDDFLELSVRNNTSKYEKENAYFTKASLVSDQLAGENQGLSPVLQRFFDSVDGVANDPSSIPARTVLLAESNSLVERFNDLDDNFTSIQTEVNGKYKDIVTDINSLATNIGKINTVIASSGDNASGDMLDQRDSLIRTLSEYVDVTVLETNDSQSNIYVGNGQPLVNGGSVSTFTSQVADEDPAKLSISLTTSSGNSIAIDDNLTGGILGGLKDFESEVLDVAKNSLGRIASGLSESFNDQHKLGLDLNGTAGVNFFSAPTGNVFSKTGNTGGSASITIATATDLSISDYTLTFNGANSYTLKKLSDDTTTAIDTGGVSPFTTAEIDGFTLDITSGAVAGDSFLVKPTYSSGGNIGLNLTNVSQVAAAGPIKTGTASDANGRLTNTGTGEITSATVTSVANLPLAADIVMTFDSAANTLTLVPDPNADGPLSYTPATESGGKSFTILGGVTFTVSGTPADGDSFDVGNNTNAKGDNLNTLSMSKLRTTSLFDGSSTTYQEAYSDIVSTVGGLTQQSKSDSAAQLSILDNAQVKRDELSGVNLDEEAANLLKFQQAYQANARAVSIADSLFQTLLQSVG